MQRLDESDPRLQADHQHVQFMIYRRRVIEMRPESASKTAVLAAIDASIASLSRTAAVGSAMTSSREFAAAVA